MFTLWNVYFRCHNRDTYKLPPACGVQYRFTRTFNIATGNIKILVVASKTSRCRYRLLTVPWSNVRRGSFVVFARRSPVIINCLGGYLMQSSQGWIHLILKQFKEYRKQLFRCHSHLIISGGDVLRWDFLTDWFWKNGDHPPYLFYKCISNISCFMYLFVNNRALSPK